MSKKIIDGHHKDYHKNGEISKEGNILNGKKSGNWRFYDNYGVLEKEENYFKGKKDGQFTIYDKKRRIKFGSYRNNKVYEYTNQIFSDNRLERIERYREGKKHGIWEFFSKLFNRENIKFRNGKKHGLSETISNGGVTTQTFYKNGVKHGNYKILQTFLSSSDKELEIGLYKEGKKHGQWSKFIYEYENKKIIESYTYKNGKLEGECFFWFSSYKDLFNVKRGSDMFYENVYDQLKKMNLLDYIMNCKYTNKIRNTKVSINFKNNKLHGPSTVHITNQNVRSGNLIEVNFKDGKKHGSFNFFTTSFKKIREINYKNGKLDGKSLEYEDLGGTLRSENNYKNGLRDGIHREFDFIKESHILREEGNFKKDKLEGVWKYYNSNGEIFRGETWKKNELVDEKDY